MKIYRKEWELVVPSTIEEVWAFFSRPENLQKMMPADMSFEILTDIAGVEMYEGMMIQYRVAPVLQIPLEWTTEITIIKPHEYFVDIQHNGPYALWHHEHHFKEVKNGVRMTDILHYAVPLGPIGRIANAVFVDGKLEEIFSTREEVTQRIFG
ncbi:MAG: SRPBCC family protein [Bacteroidota bacterium]